MVPHRVLLPTDVDRAHYWGGRAGTLGAWRGRLHLDDGRVMMMLPWALDALLDLVLPSRCVACRQPGEVWCSACRPAPRAHWSLRRLAPPIAAGTSYDGPVRAALIAYKERGLHSLRSELAAYLADAVTFIESSVTSTDSRCPAGPAVLVPVPSMPGAVRKRGGDHIGRLADLAAAGSERSVLPLLRLAGPVADSAGLTAQQRESNLSGRMSARLQAPTGPPPVVLVDDIVTTGATIREGCRALAAAGWPILGAAVVAATPRLSPAEIHGSSTGQNQRIGLALR